MKRTIETLLFVFLLFVFFSIPCLCYERSWICSEEEIKNYEDMGLDQNNIMYVLSDNTIFSIHSYFDNVVTYDSNNQVISTDSDYISVRTFENGRWYVHQYSGKLELSSFNNVCVLDINNSVVINNKEVSSIPESQIKLRDYEECLNSDDKMIANVCFLLGASEIIISSTSELELFIVILYIPLFCSCAFLVLNQLRRRDRL